MREFIQTAKIHEIFSRIFTIYGFNPRLKPESPMDFSGNTPEPLVKRESPSQDPNSPLCTELVPLGTVREIESFNDSLRLLKQQWTVRMVQDPSEYFTSHKLFSDNWC
jgi:hypothetical protein